MKFCEKLGKKVVALIVVGLLALPISAGSVQAAGNYHDTSFSFSYQGDGSDVYTAARSKYDYTSMWMDYRSGNTGFYADPFGTSSTSSTGVWSPYKGMQYHFSAGQSNYVKNTVKEKGYPYARFRFFTDKHSGLIQMSGYWSPDSI